MTGRQLLVVAPIVAIVIVVLLFTLMIFKNRGSGTLKVVIGKQSVEMKLDKNELALKDMLQLIFSGGATSSEAQILLIDTIEHLEYDHPVAKKLRELNIAGRGPFRVMLTAVKVSFPANTAINAGSAAVCKNHEFYRQQIIVLRKDRGAAIPLHAAHYIPCEVAGKKEGRDDIPANLIQINREDALKLFGKVSLDKYEEAFAFVHDSDPIVPRLVQPTASSESASIERGRAL